MVLLVGGWVTASSSTGCRQALGIDEPSLIDGTPCPRGPSDCPLPAPGCGTVACIDGGCVLTPEIDGLAVAAQVDGDCYAVVCDGKGSTRIIADPTDVEDDGNACTEDTCVSGIPQHDPIDGQALCYGGPEGTANVGDCKAGVQLCIQGQPSGGCAGEVLPRAETCVSSGDEDCDGVANEEGEGCSCDPGISYPCYDGPPETEDVGTCQGGTHICNQTGDGYGPCEGQVLPSMSVCSSLEEDQDCDGLLSECADGNGAAGDGCSATCRWEIVTVRAGEAATCALLASGAVKCWGDNANGYLGLGDAGMGGAGGAPGSDAKVGDAPEEMGSFLAAVDLGTGAVATAIAVAEHKCAILADGSLKCWGKNQYGQLGLGDANPRGDSSSEMGDALPAVNLGMGRTARAVAVGFGHTCAILDDDTMKCWGSDDNGQLGLNGFGNTWVGDSPTEMAMLPVVDLGPGRTAKAIGAGYQHTCAVLDDGTVKCWGYGGYGALGLENFVSSASVPAGPVDLGTGRTAVDIACGYAYTCALLDDGSVKCWGDYYGAGYYQNTMGDDLSPINLGRPAVSIAAGYDHACAVLDDASLKCWGYGDYGALGTGSTGDVDPLDLVAPIALGTGLGASSVTAGTNYTCSRLDNGKIKCWGYNVHGQLGLEDTINHGSSGGMGDALPFTRVINGDL